MYIRRTKIIALFISILLISSCKLYKNTNEKDVSLYTGMYTYSEGNTAYPDLYIRAYKYIQNSNYKKAESIYREIIIKEPNEIDGYIGIATCLSFQHRDQEAIQVYEDALKISPESVNAYIGLGSAYYSLEMYYEAIEMYSFAIGLDENNSNGHWGKALALVEIDREEEAIEYLNQVLYLVPGSSLAGYAKDLLNEIQN